MQNLNNYVKIICILTIGGYCMKNAKLYPTIVVPGIGQSRTDMIDEHGKKIKRAWPLDVDTKALVKKLAPSAVRMMMTRLDLGFSKALYNAIGEALEPLKCDRHGRPKNRLRVYTFDKPLSECSEDEKHFIGRMIPYRFFTDKIGEENLYYFAFNPFGCAEDTVDALRDFVVFVKERTGAEKVNLISISLGGTLVTQYLSQYGHHEDINRLIGIVSAFDGSTTVSTILENTLPLEKFSDLICELFGKDTGEKVAAVFAKLPERLAKQYKDVVFDALRDHLLLHNTTMWGAVPSGDYKRLRDALLTTDDLKHIRAYSDKAFSVRNDFKKFVSDAAENGIEIFSLCGYSLPMFVSGTDDNSDGIVHVDSCAMGKVSCPIGKTFEPSYGSVLSDDRQIDASKSAISDRVWFFKNMGHEQCAKEERLLNLAAKLLFDDSIKNVNSSDEFPQFSICK